ncbi:MAG TPA: Lrp/AsnC family transcriptional regulator [Actinopolymorphaceae bacterium]|jgi:DNA-binding Lrp family transcriptional regulator
MVALQPLGELDRKIVVALQNDGRASWTDIARMTGASVATVTRRGQHLINEGLVRIVAIPSLGQLGPIEHFLVRLRCEGGMQERVARSIAEKPYVRYVSLVTGTYDVVAELILQKGRHDLVRVFNDEILNIRGVVSSDADLVLHIYKVGHDWSRAIIGDEQRNSHAAATGTHVCAPDHVDETDSKIMEILRDDGRASFPAVAQRLGLNESTVRRRYEVLASRGCVQVMTFVPAALLGYETEVLLWLDVTPNRLQTVAEELSQLRGVRFIAATLGRTSLMCEVIMPTTADLFEFTTGILAKLDGIRAWRASLELQTLKRGFILAPWANLS